MSFPRLAGVAGIGFVTILILANSILTAAGFPTPSQAVSAEQIATIVTAASGRLRLASALLPAAWLLATIFAAGVAVHLDRPREGRADPWWIVGLAGVLMQSVVFTGVEATRLALAAAAPHGAAVVTGIWALALLGLVGWLLWLVWILAFSALLLKRARTDH